MKILQTNLNRVRAAHDLVHAEVLIDEVDLLMVAEPKKRTVSAGWLRDKQSNVVVNLYNRNICWDHKSQGLHLY